MTSNQSKQSGPAPTGKPFMWVRIENGCIVDYTQDKELAATWMEEDWPVTEPLYSKPQSSAAQSAPDMGEMVSRFLSWSLPEDVCTDPCASMPGYPHRTGTTLLTADQARAMLEHVLGAQSVLVGAVPEVQITGHLDEIDAPVWEFINAEAAKIGAETGHIDRYQYDLANGGVVVLWDSHRLHALALTIRDDMNRTRCIRMLAGAPQPADSTECTYTTQPGESVMGIANRELRSSERWKEIRDLNAQTFPDIGPHDYYPVGTVLRMPAQPAARQEPICEVSEETFSSDGTGDIITCNLPIGTKLYALPPQAGQVSVPEWVPVSERLPEEEVDVLVRGIRRGAVIHIVAGLFGGEWGSQETENLVHGEVTHWMPLPPAPAQQGVRQARIYKQGEPGHDLS